LPAIKMTKRKVEAIREAVGDDIELCIDVNNRLDLYSAIRFARAFEPYNLLFIEDPICHHEASPSTYARLVEKTKTPIACGENIYTVWDFRNYLENHALDMLHPDVCHTGVFQAKKIAALGEAYHIPVSFHNPNSPLSAVISANVAATIPNFVVLEFVRGYAYPGEDPEVPIWTEYIMNPPLSKLVSDGYLKLPEGPGWGVEIDEKELEKHPFDREHQWLYRRKDGSFFGQK